ncbi:efflux RND transporter periplasmic adaptor subunit [Castellaniella sp.]|uniref:efflux RND transporter periplasmic adaptor subunit n=1 Tax=Castellaniella sp. TaxID=1955812 RepID=UPI002AFE745B|nr:efflux RND transporter periplasmic adaptor subunit [Castellaniella sp.]
MGAAEAVRRWRVLGCWLLASIAAATAVWASRPAPPAYTTAPVERGTIRATVNALGTLRPRHYVDVGAQVSGQIQKIHVQPGDTVVAGQLLVEIDASVQQAAVDAGRASLDALHAQLDEAKAAAELAQAGFRRQQRLLQVGATPAHDVDVARAGLLAAAAVVRRIQADIRRTRAALQGDEARLGYSRIYAPIAGTVVSLDARPGQTLNAAYQTPNLLRVADLSMMTVWTQVSEADVRRLRVGMEAAFVTLAQDGRQWRGVVRQVLPMPGMGQGDEPGGAPSVSSGGAKAVFYTVLFDVPNADRVLLPRMSAQVAFVTRQADDVVLAPLAALRPAGEGRAQEYRVRVLQDGRAVWRPVQIGARDRQAAEIVTGLAEGDMLILGERTSDDAVPRFVL